MKDSHPGPTALQDPQPAPCLFSVQLDAGFPGAPAFALTPWFPLCYPALLTWAAGYSVASTWGRGRRTSRTQTLAAGERVNRMRTVFPRRGGEGRNPLSSPLPCKPTSGQPPKSSPSVGAPWSGLQPGAPASLLPQSASSGCPPHPP